MEKQFQPFALNFNNDKKVVTVTLTDEDAIFKLAQAFSDWLTQNQIENSVTEKEIIDATQEG